jgi:DNA polymerase alpha subunit A
MSMMIKWMPFQVFYRMILTDSKHANHVRVYVFVYIDIHYFVFLVVLITCSKCKQQNAFPGVFLHPEHQVVQSGLICPNQTCLSEYWGYNGEGLYGQNGDDFVALFSNLMHLAIRECTRQYFQGWVVCSEGSCGIRTQKQSLRGRKGDACPMTGCRGTLYMEYSDSALYTQLKYYDFLLHLERSMANIEKGSSQEKMV